MEVAERGDKSSQNIVRMKLNPLLADETFIDFKNSLENRIAQVYETGKNQQPVSRRRKRALVDVKPEVCFYHF